MHRTTILLPDALRQQANREARALGISLGELIRRRLAEGGDTKEPSRPRFFDRQPWTGSGPDDAAANHDAYLYGP
jgi:hypothetical protein